MIRFASTAVSVLTMFTALLWMFGGDEEPKPIPVDLALLRWDSSAVAEAAGSVRPVVSATAFEFGAATPEVGGVSSSASPTSTSTPETRQDEADGPYRLTREDFISLARTVGFQREHVIEEGYRIACGGGSTRWGESACYSGAENVNEHGRFIGLFQIWDEWAEVCGVDAEHLFYPAVNIACARIIMRQSERGGGWRWEMWEAQP